MTFLPSNHPFIVAAKALEKLEREEGGVTANVIAARRELMQSFPEYYKKYLNVKEQRQREMRIRAATLQLQARANAKRGRMIYFHNRKNVAGYGEL